MKALPLRIIFLCSSVIFLTCAVVFFIYTSLSAGISVGELETGNGQNILYLRKYDLTVKGQDKDGITYFFIPSYAEVSSISQDSSIFKLFLTDGRLLSDPRPGTIQDVNIDTGNGEIVPWRVAFMCSDNLYTAYIDIPGAGVDYIDHDIYLPSEIRLYSPFGKLAYTDDSALIKGRGNTTWEAVKQPYEIKLSESFPLCGMDSSSKWVLLANFFDDTKLLNKMAMDLSAAIGMESAIQSDWVDLYINGEYRGNYLLCKEPGIGKGRLKVSNGFLIEKDIRANADGSDNAFTVGRNVFKVKDPLPLTDEKLHAAFSYIEKIDSEIHYTDEKVQLKSIDISSFAKRFMIDEFLNNPDSMQMSYYFYKDSDTLYAGPCWDYDIACGKSLSGMEYYDYTRSLLDMTDTDDPDDDHLDWDRLLLGNKTYKEIYNSIFEDSLSVFSDMIAGTIDLYAEKTAASVAMDRALWGNDEIPVRFYSNPDNKYRFLKFYLSNRLRLLADECGYQGDLPYTDTADATTHTVTFIHEDSSISSMAVSDGTLLSENDLPAYDKSRFTGWKYQREDKPFSPYIPVYEDIVFVLIPR